MGETALDYEVTEFLAHYGVKGMQWGKRRSRSELQSAASAKKEQVKNAAKSDKGKQVAKAAAVASIAAGAAYAGHKIGGKGKISIELADKFANEQASRTLINEGSKWVKDSWSRDMLFKSGETVKYGYHTVLPPLAKGGAEFLK